MHFAPGLYDPSSSSGEHLLAHELTHVVQQGGAVARHVCDSHCGHIGQVAPTHDLDELLSRSIAADITPADTGWTVRRYSSWEHMLIGDLDPQQLATIGASFNIAGSDTTTVDIGKSKDGKKIRVGKEDVKHVIKQEIARLQYFQKKPPTAGAYRDIEKQEEDLADRDQGRRVSENWDCGDVGGAIKEGAKDKDWDVKLVIVPNNSGKKFLVTYGELNTLGDFFGSVAEMKAQDPTFVDQLIRGVRARAMRELVKLYQEVAGLEDAEHVGGKKVPGIGKTAEDKAHEELGITSTHFKSAKGKDDQIKLGGVRAELYLMGATNVTSKNVGKGYAKPTVGGDTSTDYKSTLARNACHFAPESWHAWAALHETALDLAKQAHDASFRADVEEASNSLEDFSGRPLDQMEAETNATMLREKAARLANEALLHNGFGDHYLQDSYAAGHLINTTLIMQWYVQWLDTQKFMWDAHSDQTWRTMQQMADSQPGLTDAGQYTKKDVGKTRKVTGADGAEHEIGSARNPQSVENIDGDWKVKAKALGLEVPSSLSDDDARALLVAWQTRCVARLKIRNPREQDWKATLAMAKKAGLNPTRTEKAINALWADGIVRLTDYGVNDWTKDHPLTPSTKLTLRDAYVPSGSSKLTNDPDELKHMALGVTYNDYRSS